MTSRHPATASATDLLQYRWATPLPIPAATLLRGPGTTQRVNDLYIGATSAPHVFANSPAGSGLPAIAQTVWGYGSSPTQITYPGPTLVAQAQALVKVRWHNRFAAGAAWPFVTMPHNLAPAGSMMKRYATGHTVVHLHGAHLPWTSDGYPVRMPKRPGQRSRAKTVMSAGESRLFTYPNTQPGGATLWYHDHSMDMTSRNVYAGLAGFYLLRHAQEQTVPLLPQGADEIGLALQDRSFTSLTDPQGCRLFYGDAAFLGAWQAEFQPPAVPANGVSNALAQRAATRALGQPAPEFKGTGMCVNGVLWPTLGVQAKAYRFRILNGANSRFFVLRLSPQAAGTDLPDVVAPVAAAPIHQIGGDGGFLPAIATLNGQLPAGQNPSSQDFLVLAPGERADVVIDFSTCAGSTIYLSNHAQETQPLGNGGDAASVADGSALVMQFVVAAAPVVPALVVATLDAQLLAVRPVPAAASFDAQLPAVPTRAFVVKEFGPLPLNPWEATKEEAPPPGVSARRGWNAITFQNDLSQADTPGALWGGTVPAPLPAPPLQVAAVPNGGPALDAQDLSPATRHRIGGGVELWAYVNVSVDIHPLHIHLAQMRVYGRTPVPPMPLPSVLTPPLPGTYTPPDPNEAGWKDTIRANPGEITWVLVSFDDAGDSTLDYSGHFVWHCHLLEHEDMGMMRPLEVFR